MRPERCDSRRHDGRDRSPNGSRIACRLPIGIKREIPHSSTSPAPFDAQTAAQKTRTAEHAWNRRDPEQVSLAYTEDSLWRIRAEFLSGREAIVASLRRKWDRAPDYRLIKEVGAYRGDRIAARFADEFHDDAGNWFRAYGNENWQFDDQGLMRRRIASINDRPIAESKRLFPWPLGRRPDDHPGLGDLGL